MITNERQYRITAAAMERFKRALERAPADEAGRSNVHPRLLQAEREGLESQLMDLRRELAEYEALKQGQEIVRALGVSITTEIRLVDSGGPQAVPTSGPLVKT